MRAARSGEVMGYQRQPTIQQPPQIASPQQQQQQPPQPANFQHIQQYMTKQTWTIHVETKKMQYLKPSERLWESLVSFIFSCPIKHMVITGKSLIN